MFSTSRSKVFSRGFTLLELLIVISIIAILVVLAFSIYPAIIAREKKVLAALQVSQIEEAARQYYQLFNCYPPDTGEYESADQPPTGLSSDQCRYSIMRYLGMQITDKKDGQTYGPFLRDLNEKNTKGDPTEVDGVKVQLYVDPWGNPYEMDCTHSVRDPRTRTVVVSKPYPDTVEPERQSLDVKVWSKGPDGKSSEKASFYPEDKQNDDEDNIMSWAKGKKG